MSKNNAELKYDDKILLLEKLRKAMKEKCREVNPMSLNFSHINDVFNEIRWKLIEELDNEK